MFAMIRNNIFLHFTIAKNISRNPKFWMIWATDIFLLMLALYFSYCLRFGDFGEIGSKNGQIQQLLSIFPLILLIKIPVFYFFGLYRGMWRYTSTDDLANIIKATLVAGGIIIASLLYINRFANLSRSIFILDALLTFLFISGHRVAIRYFYDPTRKIRLHQ